MSIRSLRAAPTARPVNLRTNMPVGAFERWVENLEAREEAPEASISILDVIGEDFWGDGVTVKRISAALRSIGTRDVTVNINSPGGDFFEGLAIYNALREHPAKVTVNILGLAASAASFIAMAGDEIRIPKAGFMMLHNTQVIAAGDRHALREVADWQETMDEVLAEIYADRSGTELSAISTMLDGRGDGTWLSGKRAIEAGLVDGYLAEDAARESQTAPEARATNAIRRLEASLSRGGHSRGESRKLINDLKAAMHDAGRSSGMQDAAASEGLAGLLDLARNTKGTFHAAG
ncbi:head maturation protease, ClpP-related [Limimaricola cinnabarinus]|uniref:ATP-dependent Clp protease proteolytic subunit n=1 Tax=Limimaricola cinnabarinus TaxID=1125964 RepID=A0A2G1MGY3_9RHOB|nr:head maturation protease, ClpP-related [Limimaricola cinnabarinus]PHP28006.1 hypothetical protein CJ301_08455 [Limimaricola cinnabarinus]